MAYTYKHGDRPLDGYTVQRAVGRGGFGEVYYALTDSGKQVALKYLRDNAEIELRGISMVMNIKSPHLITVYDVRKGPDGEPFVIMEYVSGPSLRDLLVAEPGGLGRQKTAFFLNGICKGLSYLHDRGIVHRDLKPGNIFYDDGYVKIGDYGLSKHISVSKHSGQTVSVGTVHYMAPEIGSGSYTKAIDIYALGVITYEMLTGRLPFAGSSMGEILMRHLSERPDLSGVPEPFAAVIARSLAKDPKDRYQDVNELMHAVLSAAGVNESLSAFDPNTLTSVPRTGAADPDRTVTGTPPPPPIPALDVHSVARLDELSSRLERRAEDLAEKFQRKTEKWEQKLMGRRGAAPTPPPRPPAPAGVPVSIPPPVPRGRVAITAIVLGAMLAVSIGLTFVMRRSLRDPVEFVFVFLLYQLGASAAALLSYYYAPRGRAVAETAIDKLARAGIGALFMLPAVALAGELRGSRISPEEFQRIIIPMIAMMALCDWRQRIDAGRRGKVQGGEAWWPGIIGLVGGAIADTPTPFIPAALCATVSLAVQAAAGMWPLRRGGATSPANSAGETTTPERGEPSAPRGWPASAADAARRAAEAAPSDSVPSAPLTSGGVSPVPVSGVLRGLFGAMATLLLAVGLGCFFALLAMGGRPSVPAPPDESWHDGLFAAQAWAKTQEPHWSDEKLLHAFWSWEFAAQRNRDYDTTRSALLFATLGCASWLIFAARKAFQRYRLPLWRGTLRWAAVSAGLTLVSGMIGIVSFQKLEGGERAAVVFALVVGGVIALVCLCVPGSRPAWAAARSSAGRWPTAGPARAWRSALRVRVGAMRARAVGGFWWPSTPSRGAAESAPPTQPAGPPDPDTLPAAPSFVGQTAQAGLAFVGKLLLVVGIAAPLLLYTVPIRVDGDDRSVTIRQGLVTVTDGDGTVHQRRLSRNLVLAPIVAGGILLVLARRFDGAHRRRALLGAAFTGIVVHQLMGPLNADLQSLLQNRSLSGLSDGGAWLAAAAAAQLLAVALIFWPARRASNTIVI